MKPLDETIALLEKQRRLAKKQAAKKEETAKKEEPAPETMITAEQVRNSFSEGKLQLEKETIFWEERSYFDGRLPWIQGKDWFQEKKSGDLNEGQGVWLSGIKKEINCYLICLNQEMEWIDLERQIKEVQNTFQQMGLYLHCYQQESLENLEAASFYGETKKGRIHTVNFWLRDRKILGNFGFYSRDFIERMVLENLIYEINDRL